MATDQELRTLSARFDCQNSQMNGSYQWICTVQYKWCKGHLLFQWDLGRCFCEQIDYGGRERKGICWCRWRVIHFSLYPAQMKASLIPIFRQWDATDWTLPKCINLRETPRTGSYIAHHTRVPYGVQYQWYPPGRHRESYCKKVEWVWLDPRVINDTRTRMATSIKILYFRQSEADGCTQASAIEDDTPRVPIARATVAS